MVDIQLLVQTVFYFVIFLCGFVVCIPVGVTSINFGGSCILYGHFHWNNQTSFLMTSSDTLNCNMPIYVSVFGCIFFPLGLGIYNAYALHKSRRDPTIASQMWVMPFVLTSSLMAALVMVTSCLISVGFENFCHKLEEGAVYKKCSDAQNKDWTNISTGKKFNVGNFYHLLTVAQLASWVCFLCWASQALLCILRFVRNRKLRSRAAAGNINDDKVNISRVEPTA